MPDVFESMDRYLAVPRVTGLAASPAGDRLVATVQTLSGDGKRYVTSLWSIDPEGGPARRLTGSGEGESEPAFLPGGDLLFSSKRPDPGAPDEDATVRLWRLPAGGGDPAVVVSRPGGVRRAVVARATGTIVVVAPSLHGPAEDDAARRAERRDAGVTGILHEALPVRHWDRDLGPDTDRLMVLDAAAAGDGTGSALRDLTPDAGGALLEAAVAVDDAGTTAYATWRVSHPGPRESTRVVAIDLATGERRVVAAADDDPATQHDLDSPAVSPDGRRLVVVDERTATPERAPTRTLSLVDPATGERRDLLAGFPLWPSSPVWTRDGGAVLFTALEQGHEPVWRVEVASGEVTRLTRSGAYSHVSAAADGRTLYALRSAMDSPARPVRLDATAPDQDPVVLDAPGDVGALPGRLEEVEVTAADGARVRAWLVLPGREGGDPAPLLLWVHGGPLMSWDSWSWRWNPWLMAARGWAVLLPDPGLSDGYGDGFVQRAWGQWGPVPFADLMAVTDAVVDRPDIDGSRTAAMGGSYGGYMANWIAGHTDRFDAIVTHASLWTLDRFIGTTDHPGAWMSEWGHPDEEPERYERNSPHRHAANIRTPMLVIHGDRDYRVPIGEGMALWSDLQHAGVHAAYLYFPDEGHWIMAPGNVRVWYETVWAFLAHHVLGQEWQRPRLL